MSFFCANTPLRILCGYLISGDAVCACAHGAAKTPIPPGTCLPGVSLQLGYSCGEVKFQSAGRTRRTPQLKIEKHTFQLGHSRNRVVHSRRECRGRPGSCNRAFKPAAFPNAHVHTRPKGRRCEGLCVGLRAQVRARIFARGAKCVRLCSATLVRSYSRVCVIARASLFLHVWRAPSKHLRTLAALHVRDYTKDSPGKPQKMA